MRNPFNLSVLTSVLPCTAASLGCVRKCLYLRRSRAIGHGADSNCISIRGSLSSIQRKGASRESMVPALTHTIKPSNLCADKGVRMPITALSSFTDGLDSCRRSREHFTANINVEDDCRQVPYAQGVWLQPCCFNVTSGGFSVVLTARSVDREPEIPAEREATTPGCVISVLSFIYQAFDC